MTVFEAPPAPPVQAVRSVALDRLRGLAVLLMVADHLALFLELDTFRTTAGRAAMPLFFVIGGHLAVRVSWRRLGPVLLAGMVLQGLAPWTGAAPLLLTFVVGVLLVAGLRRWPGALALLIGFGLMLGANGYAQLQDGAYDPRCLVALMALGALLPRSVFAAGARLPAVLGAVGRRPLTLYVGSSLLLAMIFTWT